MAKQPGVGYPGETRGLMSYAGEATQAGGQPFAPVPIVFAGPDPYEKGLTKDQAGQLEQQRRMRIMFGARQGEGVSGDHSNVRGDYLAEQFAARQAPWIKDPADYDHYDGRPTQREIDIAYYSKDRRVHGVAQATGPSGEPAPVPAPAPAHPTGPGPSGDPGPMPTPPVSPPQPAPEPPKPPTPPTPPPAQYVPAEVPAEVKEGVKIARQLKGQTKVGPKAQASLKALADWVEQTLLYVRK